MRKRALSTLEKQPKRKPRVRAESSPESAENSSGRRSVTDGSVPKETQQTSAASVESSSSTAEASHSESKSTSPVARILDVFLIDSGWNNPVCAAVRENIPAVAEYLKCHRFFVMSTDQSMAFMKRHPLLVGQDPILLVLDRKAVAQKKVKTYGFQLCLGTVRQPETAVSMLKWAVQLTMTASCQEMSRIISKSAHRETLQGMIEMMGEGSTHLLEFAPI